MKPHYITFLTAVSVLFLLSCHKRIEDPCHGVPCLNGGVCDNGECICSERYTGADCTYEKRPSRMFISRIQVLSFPSTKWWGATWDENDGPEIYLRLRWNDSLTFWRSPSFFPNASADSVYDFVLASPVQIDLPLKAHSLEIWDDDKLEFYDDKVGQLGFFPFLMGENFPSEVHLKQGGYPMEYIITFDYSWD